MSDITVVDVPARGRYEATIDGALAGYSEYQLTHDLVVFMHTEVIPSFEGRGVGSALTKFALDSIRAEGKRKAFPICPFAKGWIQRHPDYIDITYGARPSNAD